MICRSHQCFLVTVLLLGIVGAAACTRSTAECTAADTAQSPTRSGVAGTTTAGPDLSGSARTSNAASKTLPLGTTAKVTNLETGLSAVVTIQDRGPHVKGRIIDLSPATARDIGLDRQDGIATVVVAPIEVPLPDGSVKQDAAASDKTG